MDSTESRFVGRSDNRVLCTWPPSHKDRKSTYPPATSHFPMTENGSPLLLSVYFKRFRNFDYDYKRSASYVE
jgi:hypothetical protein